MSDYTLRMWQDGEQNALADLWTRCFGDDADYIRAFHERFLQKDRCVVAECDGQIVSAMYILDGGLLYPFRRNTLQFSYAYALATAPEYRGRGIGTAVFRRVCESIWASGVDAACVLPAEESLYPFYENAGAPRQLCAVREAHFTRDMLRSITPTRCIRTGALEYASMREAFLSTESHAEMTDDFCLWQEESCDRFGGGFFLLVGGLAVAEYDGKHCVIKELLAPSGEEMAAIAAVAAFCPAEEYTVRMPAFWSGDGGGEVKRYMLAGLHDEPGFYVPDDLWWGFAFE